MIDAAVSTGTWKMTLHLRFLRNPFRNFQVCAIIVDTVCGLSNSLYTVRALK